MTSPSPMIWTDLTWCKATTKSTEFSVNANSHPSRSSFSCRGIQISQSTSFRKISSKNHLAWFAKKFQSKPRSVSIATSSFASYASSGLPTKMDKKSTKGNVLIAKSSSSRISIWLLTLILRSLNQSKEMSLKLGLEKLWRNQFSRKSKTNFWPKCSGKSKCFIGATTTRSSNVCS